MVPSTAQCLDLLVTAEGDCATYIASGLTCDNTFCPSCDYAAHCDAACEGEFGACPTECQIDFGSGTVYSCQALVESDQYTCDELITNSHCTACPYCTAPPPPPPPPVAPGGCADILVGENADCATYIASGLTCASAFCPTCDYAAYCDSTCESELGGCPVECQVSTMGGTYSCQALVAAETFTCEELLAQDHCTSCASCSVAPTPPPPVLVDVNSTATVRYVMNCDVTVTNGLDVESGAGSCAANIASGTYTCSDFETGGVAEGYCNRECGVNLLEHPMVYGLDAATATGWSQ